MAHSTIAYKNNEVIVKDAVIDYLLEELIKFIHENNCEYPLQLKEIISTYYHEWHEAPPGCNYLELDLELSNELLLKSFTNLIKEYLNSKSQPDELVDTCTRLLDGI